MEGYWKVDSRPSLGYQIVHPGGMRHQDCRPLRRIGHPGGPTPRDGKPWWEKEVKHHRHRLALRERWQTRPCVSC